MLIKGHRQQHWLVDYTRGALTLQFGPPPLEDQVGIDAMLQCNGGHRGAGLLDQFQQLAFKGRTVPALGIDDRGIRLLHGVHSGQLSAHLQWSASATHTAHRLRSSQERYSPDSYDKSDVIDAETSVVEVQGQSLFDRVHDYLTDKEWSFSSYADKEFFSFALRLKDGSVRVTVDTAEGGGWSRVLVYVTYPTYVPEQRRPAVLEALALINYVTVFGNLEMDLKDGEVRVRTVLEGDGFIGESMIDRAVRKGLDTADQYQASLLAIAFGNASPTDILEMACQSNGETLQ